MPTKIIEALLEGDAEDLDIDALCAESTLPAAVLALLADASAERRLRALEVLHQLAEATELEVESCGGYHDIRRALMTLLEPLAEAPHILEAALCDVDPRVRAAALDARGALALLFEAGYVHARPLAARFAPSAMREEILAACADASPLVRAAAARALALDRGDPRVREALIAAVQDPSPIARACAVEALAEHPGEATEAALVGGLDDSDPDVRRAALQSLVALGSAAARPALLEALWDATTPFDRREIPRQMRAVGVPEAARPQLEALCADDDEFTRMSAADALVEVASPASLEALAAALERGDVTATLAAVALTRLRMASARPHLEATLARGVEPLPEERYPRDALTQSALIALASTALGQRLERPEPHRARPDAAAGAVLLHLRRDIMGWPSTLMTLGVVECAAARGLLEEHLRGTPAAKLAQHRRDRRRAAALALGHLGDPASVDALARGLRGADVVLRVRCALAIAMITGEVRPQLLEITALEPRVGTFFETLAFPMLWALEVFTARDVIDEAALEAVERWVDAQGAACFEALECYRGRGRFAGVSWGYVFAFSDGLTRLRAALRRLKR